MALTSATTAVSHASPAQRLVGNPACDANVALAPAVQEIWITPPTGWPSLRLAELWAYRDLLATFVWRDVKVRYKQTVIGVAWAVLQPLATMTVLSLVFGRLAHLDSDGAPYPAFCLAGLVPWLWFSGGLSAAANSLVGNVNLLTKVHFPRVLLPLANIVAGLIDFGVALSLSGFVLAWYGINPGARILLLPVPVAIVGLAAAGAGMGLAALHAQYRDVRYALPFLMQLGMYGTPIVYSLSIVPESRRVCYALNPLVGAIGLFRYVLLGTPAAPVLVIVSAIAAVALFVAGLAYFRSTERLVADVI